MSEDYNKIKEDNPLEKPIENEKPLSFEQELNPQLINVEKLKVPFYIIISVVALFLLVLIILCSIILYKLRNPKYTSNILNDKDFEYLEWEIRCRKHLRVKELVKIYDAQKNGDSAEKFHFYCDGINNTLVVIKSESNYKFGGYASARWDTNSYNYDDNCFVFSLNSHTSQNYTHSFSSEIALRDLGPCFGEGDIHIPNNFLKTKGAYTYTRDNERRSFGYDDYQLGPYTDNTTIEIKELEVFHVVFS